MPKFPLGRLVATPAALEALKKAGVSGAQYWERHQRGDWGDMPPEDKRTNDEALFHGDRLMSAYTLPDGTKIWIITEWDRSVTTILLPSDY